MNCIYSFFSAYFKFMNLVAIHKPTRIDKTSRSGSLTLKKRIANDFGINAIEFPKQLRILGLVALITVFSGSWATAQTTVTLFATKDTWINNSAVTHNGGNCNFLRLRSSTSGNDLARILVQFDLSSIPANATITEAKLILSRTNVTGTGANWAVHRLTNSWDEGGNCQADGAASWNQRVSGINWSTPGGDFIATPEATNFLDLTFVIRTVDLPLSLIQGWRSGTIPNHGLLLKWENETAINNTFTFYTRDEFDPLTKPRLFIIYSVPFSASITSQTNVLCAGASTGAVTVAGSGGTAPYTYSINGGAFGASGTFTGLAAGDYTVTVRDANLNTAVVVVSISPPTTITNGMNASDLIGQYTTTAGFIPNWTQGTANNNNGSVYALGLDSPRDMLIDEIGHRMFVSDVTNNRILVFNLDASNNLIDKTPDFVLGQPNFTTGGGITVPSQTTLQTPMGLAYDYNRKWLYVSDYDNSRVVVFDVTSITNGEPAINVLGQADFTTEVFATTQQTLNFPYDLTLDHANNRLFVIDNRRRVLVFDVASITDGEPAVNVLGQPDFTSSTNAITQSGLSGNSQILFDASRQWLFVAQFGANRISVFDVATITNGEPAIHVLGQPDFTSGTAATTQAGLSSPFGLALHNNRYF
jgi:hypothetical protein